MRSILDYDGRSEKTNMEMRLKMPQLSGNLANQITQHIDADAERLQGIFKDLHQNPELGFTEVRTAGIVEKEFKSLGYEVKTGIGKTGVVGILSNGPGPVVMYRADMDALNVEEKVELDYASKVRVKMPDGSEAPVGHMCGHDAHQGYCPEWRRVQH